MDEETLEAAARAIAFLGEAALGTSAAKLVKRARNVAVEAEGSANGDHQGESEGRMEAISVLLEAATHLENAESAERTLAVSGLLGAATALEAVLGVGFDMLADEAADLARQCGEFEAVVEAVQKMRGRTAAQSPVPWWWRWRRRGRRVGVSDLECGLLPSGSTSTDLQTLGTAADFLSYEAARADKFVELVENIIVSANDLGVPNETLKAARYALQADSSSLKDSVNGLEAAAMGVQKAAIDQRILLRNPVMQLVAACKEYLEASDAMSTLQHAATERARARETALVAVQNAQQPLPQPDDGPGQGDGRRSVWLGCALGGSLTLAPYLMATNAEPPKRLEDTDRLTISFVLSFWWSVLATGAICSSYARSRIELCYAQLAARVGIYGINIFAIYFFYWILGIEGDVSRCNCVWFATALHFLFLALACWRRDP